MTQLFPSKRRREWLIRCNEMTGRGWQRNVGWVVGKFLESRNMRTEWRMIAERLHTRKMRRCMLGLLGKSKKSGHVPKWERPIILSLWFPAPKTKTHDTMCMEHYTFQQVNVPWRCSLFWLHTLVAWLLFMDKYRILWTLDIHFFLAEDPHEMLFKYNYCRHRNFQEWIALPEPVYPKTTTQPC